MIHSTLPWEWPVRIAGVTGWEPAAQEDGSRIESHPRALPGPRFAEGPPTGARRGRESALTANVVRAQEYQVEPDGPGHAFRPAADGREVAIRRVANFALRRRMRVGISRRVSRYDATASPSDDAWCTSCVSIYAPELARIVLVCHNIVTPRDRWHAHLWLRRADNCLGAAVARTETMALRRLEMVGTYSPTSRADNFAGNVSTGCRADPTRSDRSASR